MVTYTEVTDGQYAAALDYAQVTSEQVYEATSSPMDILAEGDATYYLSEDTYSGYAVRTNGELVGVFSLVKGRGDALVDDAIENGATYLDCFDGYLPTFYKRHGFAEVRREANWTPGGPDVVYMVYVLKVRG